MSRPGKFGEPNHTPTWTRMVEGTGIGLATVKRIVEFPRGKVWVESTGIPGEGSRFRLSLSQAPAA